MLIFHDFIFDKFRNIFLSYNRVALLLALVMVISMLPMNVFGARQRPGVITPRSHPHGVHDGGVDYTFQIDASWLSEQPVPTGGHLFLEIETTGGPSSGGNMVGMVGRTHGNSSSPIPSNAVNDNSLMLRFSPGTGFALTSPGAFTAVTPAVWQPLTLKALGAMVHLDANNSTANLGAEVAGVTDAQAAAALELTMLELGAVGSPGGSGDPTSIRSRVLANSGFDIHWIQGPPQALQGNFNEVPSSWAEQNQQLLRSYSPVEWRVSPQINESFNFSATAAGATGNVSRMNGNVGANRPTPNLSWHGERVSTDINRHGIRTETRIWSRAVVDLSPLVYGDSIIGMEGWINVTIPIQAGDPEAGIRIRLGAVSSTGATTYRNTLLEGDLVGGFANGISITSRGVVPLSGRGRLQSIRLTEDRNGLLEGSRTVRLVAPRGFRWDTGAMPGLTANRLTAVGNPVHAGTTTNAQLDTPWITISNPNAGSGDTFSWLNPVNDREELYFRLNIPPRQQGIAALSERLWVDIVGLSLIALPGAPTSGDVTIDVYVGNGTEWALPGDSVPVSGDRLEDLIGLGDIRNTTEGPRIMRPLFGKLVESWRINNWRQYNLVVANLDDVGNITVVGPAGEFSGISGRPTAEFNTITSAASNANTPWMHAGNHTIRLIENHTGAMFRAFDIYELRPANEGARIIDARIRVGNEDNRAVEVDWARPDMNNADFIAALTDFNDGSLFFAPRTLDLDELDDPDKVLSMDIGLAMSIEAGYVAAYGTNDIDIEVFRNNELLGTVTVGGVIDPIVVTYNEPAQIYRNQFDVLALTPVAAFTISEVEPDTLTSGDEIWLGIQGVQNGRIVNIHMGTMDLFLGDPIVNESESGFAIREIPGSNGLGWRVQRPSNPNSEPGSITFEEVFLAGPTVPGIEWRVVVHGPEITENHLLPGQVPENSAGDAPNPNALWLGYVTNSANNIASPYRWLERAVFRNLPYSAVLLEVTGEAHIDDNVLIGPGGIGGRQSFTVNTMVNVDGHEIQAVAFPTVAPGVVSSMMNPRVFANFVGATMDWNDAARTATFTGTSRQGTPVTVVLTLDSPTATVNGQTVDIAEAAMQPALRGNIRPVVIAGRQYVPARFLANAFGIPIEFTAGTVTLG